MGELSKDYTIALVGNPNCGKTSLFNMLTGSKQHVGNWPGVTVERKEGSTSYHGKNIKVIDLPGTYTFSACSEDEIIAVNYILKEKPDAVINVIDSGNLERNLYLTLQLLEMNSRVVIALNMADEAEKRKIFIDKEKLSEALSTPVVPTIATKNSGIQDLLTMSINYEHSAGGLLKLDYGQVVKGESSKIVQVLLDKGLAATETANLVAIKLLEGDQYFIDSVKLKENPDLNDMVKAGRQRISDETGFDPEIYLADKRYEFIVHLIEECVHKDNTNTDDLTEKIDKIVTNKWLGLPLFFAIMFLLYQITMGFGNDFLGGYVDSGFVALGEYLSRVMVNSPELLRSFVIDAMIGGVGSVLVFVPLMLTMYFMISFLEDSGYMARAAYVMDKLMNAVGLHGKTAVSMIISSGCNVTGIMSTRTLDTKKDRMIGILISPFVSCSARLPVYALFSGVFFGDQQFGILTVSGIVFFSLYLLGIIVAVIAGKVLSKTLFKGEKSYFIMELPPYRIPTLKSTLIHMWEKTESFIRKAGTIIFGLVVIIWLLSIMPMGVEPGSADSILGKIGSIMAPLLRPAGFGSWEAAVALIVGVGAKEAIVATFGMVYGAGEEVQLASAIQMYFTPLTAYAFMVMTLLYAPCAASLGVIRRETNSTKWALFALFYSLLIGWTAAVLVYQAGRLFGFQ
ncbi:MAG: ferrous iron transporter B [Gracilibacter sp. BRH_c7a]|nr:MAG: ferrous iron transporter B [Gracilibacter sp. BRH_c7a]